MGEREETGRTDWLWAGWMDMRKQLWKVQRMKESVTARTEGQGKAVGLGQQLGPQKERRKQVPEGRTERLWGSLRESVKKVRRSATHWNQEKETPLDIRN